LGHDQTPERTDRVLAQGAVRSFGPNYVHDVANTSDRPAISVHAYSPPLTSMQHYETTSSGVLRARRQVSSW
jgi:predicted metal-dependent enzyme (double-stranded beta helix superfamily)